MTNTEPKQYPKTRATLAVISSHYPQFVVSPAMIKSWGRLLEHNDPNLLVAAVERHALTNKFPPSIAEINAAIAAMTAETPPITAAEAWGKVEQAVRKFGRDREHEAAEWLCEVWHVARLIGWKNICNADPTLHMSNRSQFIKAWGEIGRRNRQQAALPEQLRDGALAGIGRLAEKLKIEG